MRFNVTEHSSGPERNGSVSQKDIDGLASEVGRAAKPAKRVRVTPIDPTLRPTHPVLGGPNYYHWVPVSDSDRAAEIVASGLKRVAEQGDNTAAHIWLYLERAREATISLNDAYERALNDLEARKKIAREARELLCGRVQELQNLQKQATAEPTERLRDMEEKLLAVNLSISCAMAEPGVPAIAVRHYLDKNLPRNATPASVEAATPSTLDTVAAANPDGLNSAANSAKTATPPTRSWLGSFGRFLCYAPGGALIGLCIGKEFQYLEKFPMLHFEPLTNYWMGFFGAVGIGGIHLLSKGVSLLWADAAARAAEEPPSRTLFLNWRTVRHTLLPLGITGFICAVEASIVRNAIVHLATDPTNIAYFLGALPVILPAVLASSTIGWQQGRAEGKPEVHARQNRQELTTAHAELAQAELRKNDAAEEAISRSPEAQRILGMEYMAQTLLAIIAGIKEEIACLRAPFDRLLATYTAEIDMPQRLDPEEMKLLGQFYVDAAAMHEEFLREHRKIAVRMDGLLTELFHPVGTHIERILHGSVPPAPKPTFWQRLGAYLRRILRSQLPAFLGTR